MYNEAKAWLEKRAHRTFTAKHEEFSILCEFLRRHPNYDTWKFKKPEKFQITRNTQKSLIMNVKFKGLKRSRIVSWVSCATMKVKSSQKSETAKLTQAMRYAIRSQLKAFKKTKALPYCELCHSYKSIETDHYPIHFSELRDNFIAMKTKKGDNPPEKFVYHPKKGRFMFGNGNKSDKYYAKRWKISWQTYHRNHATYRFLCSTCNRKTNH